MINVLIVDDEKIVRRGLVTFMPWDQFGMEVVGEANNGENALKFLENNKVDLLFTDLSMPVMSGIELMREVTKLYPHIQIVVLTLHQNFDYIQEALRLGAIDYIAKTELEKEQFEDILQRIVSVIDTKKIKGKDQPELEYRAVNQIYVAYPLLQHSDTTNEEALILDGANEVETDVWYWTYLPKQFFESTKLYACVCIQEISGLDRKSIVKLIRSYRRHGLFYDYDPKKSIQYVKGDQIEFSPLADEYDVQQLKKQWLLANWIYDHALFENMLDHLKQLRLPSIRLNRLFFSLTDEWNRLYGTTLEAQIVIKDDYAHFYEFAEWINETRMMIHRSNVKPEFSLEIQSSITKAKMLAQQLIHQPISAAEMAKSVNMSLSYFSQCFKQIVGQTYTDYLREIRMEKAKSYLSNTLKTIQWIAEDVGYNDEKYFSRLFKEHVGMLPSEYRQQMNHEKSKL